MLIHCQDVAQAAIERSLLVYRRAACRLVDELHHIDADADDVRIGAGEQGHAGGLPGKSMSRRQILRLTRARSINSAVPPSSTALVMNKPKLSAWPNVALGGVTNS